MFDRLRITRRAVLGSAGAAAALSALPWAGHAHAATVVIADDRGREIAIGKTKYRNMGFAKGELAPFEMEVIGHGRAHKAAICVEGMPVPLYVPVYEIGADREGLILSSTNLLAGDTVSFSGVPISW